MKVEIRFRNVERSEQLAQFAERQASAAFDRFAPVVSRVVVRIADVNGPKGGEDKVCRVLVKTHGFGSLIVRQRDQTVGGALAVAFGRASRTLGGMIERKRTRRPAGPRFEDGQLRDIRGTMIVA
ncbi:MAG: hypothetical protein H6707_12630 [Deltaproteobacteria bacterium]|nr:hypothetical protein [Deltaproteobacteria bacterium]